MLTVPDAARRAGRSPETVRRWIRSGRLRAHKVGTQHVIEEADLAAVLERDELPIPSAWGSPTTGFAGGAGGRPLPSVVGIIRRQRAEH